MSGLWLKRNLIMLYASFLLLSELSAEINVSRYGPSILTGLFNNQSRAVQAMRCLKQWLHLNCRLSQTR